MTVFIHRLYRLIRPINSVPAQYRQTFLHLYMDVFWFGILSGATIAFLAVYATRQGATTQQIGLLTAAPALVNLIFALPVGNWLAGRAIGRKVFLSSIFQRVFYILLVPLPLLLMPKVQVWVIIAMTLIMNIPGTALVVGFNSLFGEVVPLEWRGYVVGLRNAALAVVSTVFTLISGEILNRVAFPTGYQIVFAMGVIGAALSSLHLYYLSVIVDSPLRAAKSALSQPQTEAGRRLAFEIRALMQRGMSTLRLDAMRGPFGRIMMLLFGWHLFQYMAIPVFTPFIVNQLHLSDQTIGLAAALFSGLTFVGSLMFNNLSIRFGNKLLTASGIMILCLYPIITSFGATPYIFANIIGGLAWALVGGALYNYILENSPRHDLPAYLAWYNLVFNAAILLGSSIGPGVAGLIGYRPALVLFGVGRFLAGLAILLWG